MKRLFFPWPFGSFARKSSRCVCVLLEMLLLLWNVRESLLIPSNFCPLTNSETRVSSKFKKHPQTLFWAVLDRLKEVAYWMSRTKSSWAGNLPWRSSLHLSTCSIYLKVKWSNLLSIPNKLAQQLAIRDAVLLQTDALPDPCADLWTFPDTLLAERADGGCVWVVGMDGTAVCFR